MIQSLSMPLLSHGGFTLIKYMQINRANECQSVYAKLDSMWWTEIPCKMSTYLSVWSGYEAQ